MVKRLPIEAIVWSTGLLMLGIMGTGSTGFSICPLANTGLAFCPGCGLGESVALFFRGRIADSLAAHPLGIPAILILSHRILKLTKQYSQTYGKSY